MENGVKFVLSEGICEIIIDGLTNAAVNVSDKKESDNYYKVAGKISEALEKVRNGKHYINTYRE